VDDRPGHDLRYAVDTRKIQGAVGWIPQVNLEDGLAITVKWYQENRWWWEEEKKRTEARYAEKERKAKT